MQDCKKNKRKQEKHWHWSMISQIEMTVTWSSRVDAVQVGAGPRHWCRICCWKRKKEVEITSQSTFTQQSSRRWSRLCPWFPDGNTRLVSPSQYVSGCKSHGANNGMMSPWSLTSGCEMSSSNRVNSWHMQQCDIRSHWPLTWILMDNQQTLNLWPRLPWRQRERWSLASGKTVWKRWAFRLSGGIKLTV